MVDISTVTKSIAFLRTEDLKILMSVSIMTVHVSRGHSTINCNAPEATCTTRATVTPAAKTAMKRTTALKPSLPLSLFLGQQSSPATPAERPVEPPRLRGVVSSCRDVYGSAIEKLCLKCS